jgi:hypothetical protein
LDGAVSTIRSKPNAGATRGALANSTAGGGLLVMLCGWAALFVLLVVLPIVLLANGIEPGAVGMWMAMVVVSMAISWWSDRREQRRWLKRHGRPPVSNFPCSESYQAEWSVAERPAWASPVRQSEPWWLRWLKPRQPPKPIEVIEQYWSIRLGPGMIPTPS